MFKYFTFFIFSLFLNNSFSQNNLPETFPDGYYYDGLNDGKTKKTPIGLHIGGGNWTNNTLVFNYNAGDTYARHHIDIRSIVWSFEYEFKERSGMKKISDTLFREKGYSGEPDSEDYYALIPSKKYIAHYNIIEGKIILKHVYMNDKKRAKTFMDSTMVYKLIEDLESNIKEEVATFIEADKIKIDERLARGLPEAKISDPNLEALFLKTIQEYATNNGWKETFTKVVITSDWWYPKNQYSGRVVGKKIEIAAVAKWPDGKCTYQMFNITEDVTDNSGKNLENHIGQLLEANIKLSVIWSNKK